TTSGVSGGGHSIGVPLAVSAKSSIIVPASTMTLHPVRLNGTVIGVPQTYNYLQRMQDRITGFIAAHSKINIDELRRLMMNTDELANDVGTIIDGNAAVSCGLIDEIGGVSDAVKYLRGTMTGE
ncbi:MAG: S49 family peptidase, partial [Clostridia bacterium]|nr:S49 family peptidase [Clostridia bacterium]